MVIPFCSQHRMANMKYSKFQQLVKGKEKANVDFKTRCDAFLSRRLAPKAELARDICAMANNGNVASYILVGVSDDGQSFESVTNVKLTDDRLQSFCKAAIFPPPKIRVHREQWAQASSAHAGKDFVIIQVGPNARQAFCLARDFIAYREKICFRRNEVWIRRGATSDLATPEEIARLMKGQPPEGKRKPEDNVQYARLPRDKQLEAMLNDFQKCVEEIGGCFCGHRVVIPLRKLRYVWRYVALRECTQEFAIPSYASYQWQYEHGVLFLVIGTVSKRAFPTYAEVNFREKWGWFTYYSHSSYLLHKRSVPLPVNTKETSLVILTLPNLADTDALRSAFHSLLQFLDTDQDSYSRIRLARDGININLRRWLRQGWLIRTNRFYARGRPKKSDLGKNEIFDRRYGNAVLKREKTKKLTNMAQTVLDLSAGKLP